MTVKEGEEGSKSIGPYKMTKMNPLLGSGYAEHLIHDNSNINFLEAWDLLLGVNSLAETISVLTKVLDVKKGAEPEDVEEKVEDKEPDTKPKEIPYHLQID